MASKKKASKKAAGGSVGAGVEGMSFTPAGGMTTHLTFTGKGVAALRKLAAAARPQGNAEEIEGQGRLPGTPELEEILPYYAVTLTAHATRTGFGRPQSPEDLDANQNEEALLFVEKVSRTVEVHVPAHDYDDARERGEAKIKALVGGVEQLFANYPARAEKPDWKVRRLK